MSKYFYLKMKNKMSDGMVPYGLKGLHSEAGIKLDIQNASPASVKNRQLEWYIPNTIQNHHWVSLHYSDMIVLQAGEESQLEAANLMKGLPAPMESTTLPPVESPPEVTPTVLEPEVIEPTEPAKPKVLMGDIVSPDELPSAATKEEITRKRNVLKASLDVKGIEYYSNAPLAKLESLDVEN